ncbi:urea transporter [Paraburkholderia sp. BR14262]|uniref:urea transporter n=1 Tax=Paraburkholderia sp. BR14262 TaxID=3236999 RepID=UPI0034CD8786
MLALWPALRLARGPHRPVPARHAFAMSARFCAASGATARSADTAAVGALLRSLGQIVLQAHAGTGACLLAALALTDWRLAFAALLGAAAAKQRERQLSPPRRTLARGRTSCVNRQIRRFETHCGSSVSLCADRAMLAADRPRRSRRSRAATTAAARLAAR